MNDIYTKIDEISSLIKNRECVTKIKLIEKQMECDEEVLRLVIDFETAQREYSICLNHYDENSKEAKAYQKNLFEKKLILDSHPLIKKYYELLKEVNEPLRYIEMKLLSLFKIDKGKC